jgi:hypothetical protein
MDIATILTAIGSSGILSIGVARWLTQRLIDHRLTKDLKTYQLDLDERLAESKTELDRKLQTDLKTYQAALDGNLALSKAELDSRVSTAKSELDASLRRSVEEYLGDKTAERQYRFDARKRLYTAIGPLRFQLARACDEFTARIDRIGTGKQPYATSLAGYFGRSTLFRLLRLFAITELIERQIADADFSVDPSTVNLLRFKHQAFMCLSSSTVVLNHPNAQWTSQIEHVFFDTLSIVSAALIFVEPAGKQDRVMRFDEFSMFVEEASKLERIHPFPRLFEDFTVDSKPILWVRLVTLAQLCNTFLATEGPPVGITPESYDCSKMLLATTDKFINDNHQRYCEMVKTIIAPIQN